MGIDIKDQCKKNELKEVQSVEVYVMISGDYCAFHEIGFNVVFDITNNIDFGGYSLSQLQNWEADYSDVEYRTAYLIDGIYFVEWD